MITSDTTTFVDTWEVRLPPSGFPHAVFPLALCVAAVSSGPSRAAHSAPVVAAPVSGKPSRLCLGVWTPRRSDSGFEPGGRGW